MVAMRQEIDNPVATKSLRYYRAPTAFKRCECRQARAVARTAEGYRCETCLTDEGLSIFDDEVMML